MKQRVLLLLLLFLSWAQIHAENYPYRSDYLFVTVPDHANWLYKAGEKATIEVQFYKYGIPRDGVVKYTIANDMLKADHQGSVKLKNGRAKIDMGTRSTPGFRDLRLSVTVDSVTYLHHVKVGFSVDKIRPWTQEPADFTSFWQNSISQMRQQQDLSYTQEPAKEYTTDKIDCYLIKLKIDRNYSLYGYLFLPKNAKSGTCPAVLCPPGAGVKTIKEPLRHKYYAENGFIRLETEIHGLDPRLPQSVFSDVSHAFNGGDTGYLESGIDNRDRYYMHHVYLGLVRCLDLLTSLPQWDGKNLAVQGGSQGGALSIVAAGLDPRVTQCIVNHPALSDMAAYVEPGRTGGYPHFNKMRGLLTPGNIKTMAYYDVVNFARHITCPVYMTWGYNDDACPPTTSYAVWNTLKCPKESLITPINEHWTSEATEYGHMVWLKKHLVR
ncbi:MAG: acetylxylan esterase [Prevotella sp.]|nr:acetylxylan esterase [Prevotella sp.]